MMLLSPVPAVESSAPPSLSDDLPSGAPSLLCDTFGVLPPRRPAQPPAAAAAPEALVQTRPPKLFFRGAASPIALS